MLRLPRSQGRFRFAHQLPSSVQGGGSVLLYFSDASTPARESIECRVLVECVVSGQGQDDVN